MLPLERQAGVDGMALRRQFPDVCMVGHYDKMVMTAGRSGDARRVRAARAADANAAASSPASITRRRRACRSNNIVRTFHCSMNIVPLDETLLRDATRGAIGNRSRAGFVETVSCCYVRVSGEAFLPCPSAMKCN